MVEYASLLAGSFGWLPTSLREFLDILTGTNFIIGDVTIPLPVLLVVAAVALVLALRRL